MEKFKKAVEENIVSLVFLVVLVSMAVLAWSIGDAVSDGIKEEVYHVPAD